MRYIAIILFVATTAIVSQAQSKAELETKIKNLQTEIELLKQTKSADIANPLQRASYSLGVVIANNIKAQGADSINTDAFTVGLLDALNNKPLKLDQQQCNSEVQTFMVGLSEKRAKRASANGARFLEANKKKAGVIALPSGLQYEVITSGAGKSPILNDRVTVHYTGKFTDGTIFESSVQRGQPATFGVTQVIAGWTEALQLMKEGDKWIVYIPFNLGYGERGSGKIPPYSTLIFELELIKVN